jgi:hypothetical protein
MIFLLANWRLVLTGASVAVLAYGLHTLDVYRIEDRHRVAMEAQAQAMAQKCKDDKTITQGVSNAYQKKLADLNRRYRDLGRVQQHECVALSASGPSGGRDAASPSGGHVYAHAVDPSQLFEYADDAERIRLQLIACQSFVSGTWASQGQ